MAIYFRAALALLTRFIKRIALPFFDLAFMIVGLFLMTKIWEHEQIEFPKEVLRYAIPGYALTWLFSVLFSGGYDFPVKLKSYIKGGLIGTGIILIIYALLPKTVQFSRLYILLGAAWVILYYVISRILLHLTLKKRFDLSGIKSKNFAIIGDPGEVDRVQQILKNTTQKVNRIHRVSPTEEKNEGDTGLLSQLDQIVHIHKIDEVIFCAKNTTAEMIIEWMSRMSSKQIEFKIAQPESMYLIGSNSIDSAGDLYVMEIDNISTATNKRNKRAFDFLISLLFLVLSPIAIWFFNNKIQFLKNIWTVFTGRRSLVGYSFEAGQREQSLPQIREGILTPTEGEEKHENIALQAKLNLIYARDYTILTDLQILLKNWRKLDR